MATDGGTTPNIRYFTEANSEEQVISRITHPKSERFREIMISLIGHLHAMIKDTELTQEEWDIAIDFLTRTGQKCDASRQEYILLSDTLGVSMLVDAINHRKHGGATENTVLGPFYVANAPIREMGANINLDGKGLPLFMSGKVIDIHGNPISGALIDTWMTNEDGFYDVQQPATQPKFNLRGRFYTKENGAYWFRGARPRYYPLPTDGPVGEMLLAMGRHPYRPAHIHFIVSAPGYIPVTTHVFMRGDTYLESDAVFGVKESLIIDFTVKDDPSEAARLGVANPFCTAHFDFVLQKEGDASSGPFLPTDSSP
jgi:protocatechuate 3,4-dioxygenase beta subunit